MNALFAAFNLGSLQDCKDEDMCLRTCPNHKDRKAEKTVALRGNTHRIMEEENQDEEEIPKLPTRKRKVKTTL